MRINSLLRSRHQEDILGRVVSYTGFGTNGVRWRMLKADWSYSLRNDGHVPWPQPEVYTSHEQERISVSTVTRYIKISFGE